VNIFGVSPLSVPSVERSDRQLELLAAFEQLIAREGFRSLTVASIADRLHCSRSTLYELAPSKDALVELAVGRLLEGMVAAQRADAAQAAGPPEALAEFVRSSIRESSRFSRAYFVDVTENPRCRTLLEQYNATCAGEMLAYIQAGMAAGDFRSDLNAVLATHAAMGAVARMQDPRVLEAAGASYPEAIEHTFSLIVGGLRQGSDLGASTPRPKSNRPKNPARTSPRPQHRR